MAYRVELNKAAQRDLRRLSPQLQDRITPRIYALADDPRPPGAKKLAGQKERWRVRVGDYRVIYEIHGAILLVLVVTIGHRREVYR